MLFHWMINHSLILKICILHPFLLPSPKGRMRMLNNTRWTFYCTMGIHVDLFQLYTKNMRNRELWECWKSGKISPALVVSYTSLKSRWLTLKELLMLTFVNGIFLFTVSPGWASVLAIGTHSLPCTKDPSSQQMTYEPACDFLKMTVIC